MCSYCGHYHEDICPKNPAYFDGDEDVKVPDGSAIGDDE